jgi:hypothetical protein
VCPHDVNVGARTQSAFRFQHECTARKCLGMLAAEQPVELVVCEWHDDFVVEYAGGVLELVSVKHREGGRGPWSVATLCEGALPGLYRSWRGLDGAWRARLMTNGALRTGAGEASALADACHSRDGHAIGNWAARLADALGGSPEEVAAFLRVLSVESGLPARAHIGAVHIRDLVRPALRDADIDEREAEGFYARLLGEIERRNRDRVGDAGDDRPRVAEADLQAAADDAEQLRERERRTLARADIEALVAALPRSVTSIVVHRGHALLGEVPLVARGAQLDELLSWFAGGQSRVFCLTGPGGQGKSALAWTFFGTETVADNAPIRVWHSLGPSADHAAGLEQTLARVAPADEASESDAAQRVGRALEELSSRGALVVLDGLEHAYGRSENPLDSLSADNRTLADYGVEVMLRRLIALPGVRVLVVARVAPSFLDDPALPASAETLHLEGLRPTQSSALWRALGVPGNEDDHITATSMLRGNPLLVRLVARAVAVRRARTAPADWLRALPDTLSEAMSTAQVQEAALSAVLEELDDDARLVAIALAASRRRLGLEEWLGVCARLMDDEEARARVAVDEVLERGLAHEAADAEASFEMHDLVADRALALASPETLAPVYQEVDALYGIRFVLADDGGQDLAYNTDVIAIESVESLRQPIGLLRALLDRGLIDDALHVFWDDLFLALRFRLTALGTLRDLIGDIQAAHIRIGKPLAEAPLRPLAAELAALDDRCEESLSILEDSDITDENIRAVSLLGTGQLAEAYAAAESAAYAELQRVRLEHARDYTGYQLLAGTPLASGLQASIDRLLAMRTMCGAFLAAGYRRLALMVATNATRLSGAEGQETIMSMVEETYGTVLLALGEIDGAARAAEAARNASASSKIVQHDLGARVLALEIDAARGTEGHGDSAAALLLETQAHGLGHLAQRCRAVLDRSAAEGVIASAARWATRDHPDPPPRSMADPPASLADELRAIARWRPEGHWTIGRIAAERSWLQGTLSQLSQERRAIAKEHLDLDEETLAQLREEGVLPRSLPEGGGTEKVLDAALGRLDIDEADDLAAEILVEHWDGLVPGEAYERLTRCALYRPGGMSLRRALLRAADAADALPSAVGLLEHFANNQVDTAVISLEFANIARRHNDHAWTVLSSDAGLRANFFLLDRSAAVTVALAFGAGWALVRDGNKPELAADIVPKALGGHPIVIRYDDADPSSALRLIGTPERADSPPPSWTFMDQIQEQQMLSEVIDHTPDSADGVLSWCFARSVGLEREAPPEGAKIAEAVELLKHGMALVEHEDELKDKALDAGHGLLGEPATS